MRFLRYSPFLLLATSCTALLGDFNVEPSATTVDAGPDVVPVDSGVEAEPGPTSFALTPATATIGVLRAQTFTAAEPVTWKVMETTGGTVSDTGTYVAPLKPGTYHVVATSKADPLRTGTATVTVVPLMVTLAGGQPGGAGNVDGPPRMARFRDPSATAWAPGPKTMVISDASNRTIRRWDSASNKVVTVAGTPGASIGSTNGVGAAARFYSPTDIAIDDMAKTAWVVDRPNHCIRTINLMTNAVTTLAGTCDPAAPGHVDGMTGATSEFDYIYAMILAPQRDALYVCDFHQVVMGFKGIRRVEIGGTNPGRTTSILSNNFTTCYLAGDATAKIVYFNDGTGMMKRFDDPVGGAAVNPATTNVAGSVPTMYGLTGVFGGGGNDLYSYYFQASLNRYHFGNPGFDAASFVGNNSEIRVVDGPIATARFTGITGLSADSTNNTVFITDRAHIIRKMDVTAGTVSTMLGAMPNVEDVDGNADVARMVGPIAAASDDAGNIYFAEAAGVSANPNLLRKLEVATGKITPFAGITNLGGNPAADGAANAARFGIPYDLVRIGGDIYVVDIYGQAIRKVVIATGAVSTPFGELNQKGNSDGVGPLAHFNLTDVADVNVTGYGAGIATDGKDLYITDGGNFSVRKLTVATGASTTIAGGTRGNGDGMGKSAQFILPSGIAHDAGFLYVTDVGGQVIKRIDLATSQVTTWLGFANVQGTLDGEASVATFSNPFRIVADGNGSLFVTEAPPQSAIYAASPGRVVRHIDIKTKRVTTFAGVRGSQGILPGDLPSSLNCPAGLSFSSKRDLVITDFCDGAIVALKPHL